MPRELDAIQAGIHKKVSKDISCSEFHSSVVLEGRAASWGDVVKAGKLAAKRGYKGVVNRVEAMGAEQPPMKKPAFEDGALEGRQVDVLIIGGGVIGCSIARELSKWDISILLAEKEADLAMHASSRNDGMIHPGIEPRPGSKKAVFNVLGNRMYTQVAKELDVPFERIGSIVLFDKWWVRLIAPVIHSRAKQSGVEGVKFLSREEVKQREPNVTDEIAGGVFFPSAGVLSPYKLTIAYAENAAANGAEISLNTAVLSMKLENGRIVSVTTNRGVIYPKAVINAAGVFADNIAAMAGDQFFTIHPRKGETVFLDKKKGALTHSVLAKPSLSAFGGDTKGGGLVKTIDGNLLVGPDAYEQPYKEDFSTNRAHIERVLAKHLSLVPGLSPSDVITYCAGIRAPTYEEEFIIEASEYVGNLVYAAGIQSPGLASAPAIAAEIERLTLALLRRGADVRPRQGWNPVRRGIPRLHGLDAKARGELIKLRPDYGEIVCRCEEISRGEVADALRSPIPVYTVDAVKRRVRAGMGRCQGGFCMPLVMETISRESGLGLTEITKKGGSSNILPCETKSLSPKGGD